MKVSIRYVWLTFIRLLIGLLAVGLAAVLFFVLNPSALRDIIRLFPIPGIVEIPGPGQTPPPPRITAPSGELPGGYRVFRGTYIGGSFGCSFVLELADGRQVGVGAAHATPHLSNHTQAELWTPDQTRVAGLAGQIGRGYTFYRDNFTTDFVIWAVTESVEAQYVLIPDSRGHGEKGESVLVVTPEDDGVGGSKTRPGVVMEVAQQATWIQLKDSFEPVGLSGCPVLSTHTGMVIGIAVAGENKPPVVMGLNPVGALMKEVYAALSAQR